MSKILIMEPHLSELVDLGHIVTAGKDTSSIEYASVSTTVMVGTLDHAVIKKFKSLVSVIVYNMNVFDLALTFCLHYLIILRVKATKVQSTYDLSAGTILPH